MPQTILAKQNDKQMTTSRQKWAKKINGNWRKSIEAIIATGQSLVDAKKELPHGQFQNMIESDLDFGPMMAIKLMAIAKMPALQKDYIYNTLPASWSVLYELRGITEADLEWAIERGLVKDTTSLGAARALRKHFTGNGVDPIPGPVRKNIIPQYPSPTEARQIARETGRIVAARDGRLYTGLTEEESGEQKRRTSQTYRVMDAINLLADLEIRPAGWIEEAHPSQLVNLKKIAVRSAIEWLTELLEEIP